MERKQTHLWVLSNTTKRAERIVHRLLVHLRIQRTDKQIRSYVQLLFIVRGLVDSYRFTIKFDLVHDFNGVICVLLRHEFAEPKALVRHRDPVFRQEHVCCGDTKMSMIPCGADGHASTVEHSHTGPACLENRISKCDCQITFDHTHSISSHTKASDARSSRLPCRHM